jgi:hypothetical protein
VGGMADPMTEPTEVIEVSTYMHPIVRAGLGLFAIIMLMLAFHELGRGLWPLSIFSLFFGFMLMGALSVCGPVIMAVVWGPNERWIIESGQLTVVNELRQFKRSRNYPCTIFVKSSVQPESWDSGPDTYRLCLTFTDGRNLKSPSFKQEADAREALARLINY